MRRVVAPLLVTVAMIAVVAGVAVALRQVERIPFLDAAGCRATVNGHTVDVTPEQAENAALIASVAVRRGLPPRAVSIALATAYQESGLVNIDYGDRDSVGLFQQRPSQGWGSVEEIMDPLYSTTAFYDALVEVEGYTALDVTVAAQAVQRSAFPDAYADHEADARALASALTGQSPAALSCDVDGEAATATPIRDRRGLTQRAAAVRGELRERFGVGTAAARGTSGRDAAGRVLALRGRAEPERAWAVAHYLVANAGRLEIATVTVGGRTWNAGGDGWRTERFRGDRLRVTVLP